MLTVYLPGKNLIKALDFFDKIVGSQENRYLTFFASNGLCLAGGDGILNACLILKPKITFPYTYTFCMDGLRTFLKDKIDQSIKIEIGSYLKFTVSGEYLELKTQPGEITFTQERGTTLGIISTQTLRRIFDLASLISQEGEKIFLFLQKGHLGAIGENFKLLSCAFTSFPSSHSFSLTVPYSSLRHLVKSLQLISEKQVNLFLSANTLDMTFSWLKMSLHFSPVPHQTLSLLKSALMTSPLAKIKLDLKTIQKNLARVSRIQKQLNALGKISFTSKKCIFCATSSQGTYTITLPLPAPLPQSFSITCHFPHLYSLCRRLRGKEITISILPSGWVLKHGQFFCFLRKEEKPKVF
ncbi:MAG: hypothetical protein J7M03_01080 [Candidatus Desulfofervidaceae bacterium]|nr:hypothetical protein [Candidatus Desulfofervidaceae bacterium]MDL1970923.1 hypothetical protein [Candidatus Desulfofervidaceae bacterium]